MWARWRHDTNKFMYAYQHSCDQCSNSPCLILCRPACLSRWRMWTSFWASSGLPRPHAVNDGQPWSTFSTCSWRKWTPPALRTQRQCRRPSKRQLPVRAKVEVKISFPGDWEFLVFMVTLRNKHLRSHFYHIFLWVISRLFVVTYSTREPILRLPVEFNEFSILANIPCISNLTHICS